MVHFPFAVDVIAGVILEVELLFIEQGAADALLGIFLAQAFQQNRSVSVKYFIGFADGDSGCPSQANVVFVFTGNGTEDLIGTSVDGFLAEAAASLWSLHNQE